MNTLTKYLRQEHTETRFRYVGTIWGTDQYEVTGQELADILDNLGYGDETMGDHPTNGGGGGYYYQSGDIYYRGGLVDEKVLETLE